MPDPTLFVTTEGHRDSRRGIAATKGIKATTDYTDFTDGKRRTKRKLNLDSRTHERITVKINYEKETAFLWVRPLGAPDWESGEQPNIHHG